jgi:hypothetical protein
VRPSPIRGGRVRRIPPTPRSAFSANMVLCGYLLVCCNRRPRHLCAWGFYLFATCVKLRSNAFCKGCNNADRRRLPPKSFRAFAGCPRSLRSEYKPELALPF